VVSAQDPGPPPPLPEPDTVVVSDGQAPVGNFEPPHAKYPRIWATPEYLYWWVKNGPLQVPLVTTGSTGDAVPGAIGQPTTSVLFGNQNLNYGGLNGVRFSAGGYLDSSSTIGLEASAFVLENGSVRYAPGSNANGSPALFVPVFRSDLGIDDANTIASPGTAVGNINIASTSRLWGVELNSTVNILRLKWFDLDWLAGVRYLNLRETLDMSTDTSSLTANVNQATQDSFHTSNQFIGPQFGFRIGTQCGKLDAWLTGKIAVGPSQEVVDISGQTIVSGSSALTPGTFAGGYLTQPTNIGRQTADPIVVVPQLQFKVSWEIHPMLRVHAGYDILYWSQVVRPGLQIDQHVNQTQAFGGALVGVATPAALFSKSDYFANGFNVGFEIRY
jgi:hypothetical protein